MTPMSTSWEPPPSTYRSKQASNDRYKRAAIRNRAEDAANEERRRAARRSQQQAQCNLVQLRHQLDSSERNARRVRDVISPPSELFDRADLTKAIATAEYAIAFLEQLNRACCLINEVENPLGVKVSEDCVGHQSGLLIQVHPMAQG